MLPLLILWTPGKILYSFEKSFRRSRVIYSCYCSLHVKLFRHWTWATPLRWVLIIAFIEWPNTNIYTAVICFRLSRRSWLIIKHWVHLLKSKDVFFVKLFNVFVSIISALLLSSYPNIFVSIISTFLFTFFTTFTLCSGWSCSSFGFYKCDQV